MKVQIKDEETTEWDEKEDSRTKEIKLEQNNFSSKYIFKKQYAKEHLWKIIKFLKKNLK